MKRIVVSALLSLASYSVASQPGNYFLNLTPKEKALVVTKGAVTACFSAKPNNPTEIPLFDESIEGSLASSHILGLYRKQITEKRFKSVVICNWNDKREYQKLETNSQWNTLIVNDSRNEIQTHKPDGSKVNIASFFSLENFCFFKLDKNQGIKFSGFSITKEDPSEHEILILTENGFKSYQAIRK
jgi:hypothetical protein